MLPQTNLQLYQLLIQQYTDDESLERVRAAYDVARQLFANAFRPSHKPFICHLVGTGGALASWGQSIDSTIAGLLHSAYLYGRFGDHEKGATPARRNWLRAIVGSDAEELICEYTEARWKAVAATELREKVENDHRLRQITTIKLADLLDEFCDNGPKYSPAKPLEFGILDGTDFPDGFLSLVDFCAGPLAVDQFRQAFATFHSGNPPQCLRSDDRSFHFKQTGVRELKSHRIVRSLSHLRRYIFRSRAA